MKKSIFITNWMLLALLLTSCENKQANIPEEAPSVSQEQIIEEGAYLVGIMGCADCHTPKKMSEEGPVPDMDRWLMGHPSENQLPPINQDVLSSGNWALFNNDLTIGVGPWGITFSANLTPHETGLGNWTYEQFKKAMREGKFKGMDNTRPIMPPMPWQNFKAVKEDDLQAIFEYLKTIPPIDNTVPVYIPPTAM
jgi:hypothetical protein